MKIVFICGSLEPGRDGVGDYVSRLAGALEEAGHEVALLALNDRHITAVTDDKKSAGGRAVLRLPEGLAMTERENLMNEWLRSIDPDWISLQYVPFSFERKGLCFGLAKLLKRAGKGRKWHIMFHEVSVGLNKGCGIKSRLWGLAQEFIVNGLLKKLKPLVVHTHNQVYKTQLERLGARVILLPLFSNIPVQDVEQIAEKISGQVKRKQELTLVMFGGIHPGAPVADFARVAKEYGILNDAKLKLRIIGRSGAEQERWLTSWKAEGLEAEPMGAQPEDKISEILAGADFGVFTTPLALVEKSGSVAAMREHGVRLLAVSPLWEPRGMTLETNPFGIKAFDGLSLNSFFTEKGDFSYLPVLTGVAKQFSVDLFKH